jgi:threonine dehydrogenase-like Zn-dependent dehydrogenase
MRSGYGCGKCAACARWEPRLCAKRGGTYGYTDVNKPPHLWGGYAQYLYLEPHALVHRIDKRIPPEIATLFNPIGAGFRWTVEMPRLKAGETIVVLGPGQRGLGSVIAAREAGAGTIIVTGLSRDERKLALSRQYGADYAVNVEQDDVRKLVRDVTDGIGADIVIDVTAYAVDAVTQAIDLARRGGRVVLAGTKGPKPVPDFYSDRVVTKEVTLIGALGVDWPAYDAAVRLIESGKYDLAAMHTHSLPLTDAEHGLELLAGRVPGQDAVHIALMT